jgi:hypothetical protein
MSYRHRFGLGADNPEELGRARTTVSKTDYGQPWLMIGVSSPEYQQLRRALAAMGFPTGLGSDEHAKADMGTGLGLFAAWLRFGRVEQWWIHGGMQTDSLIVDWGRRLRVHQQLYTALLAGHPAGKVDPWAHSPDGYVHLLGGSSAGQRDLLIDRIVARLISGGYLPPLQSTETVQARTDSYFGPNNEAVGGSAGPFLGDRSPYTGLRLAYNELKQSGVPIGDWPTGVDFGATMGRELRVNTTLLKALLDTTRALPGEFRIVRQRAARVTMRRIIGGFPRVGR